ncbi:MAG: response regulator transcription factor [Chloroflexi bacterium]|nr:response regulator transcription factor [Chloroflexota bacterium]MDA1220316.1 response regulator transcription factor [Chloroflexota bacterium]
MSPNQKQVLVVEDDVKTADIVKAYLEKDGYDVLTAHDGHQGLTAARYYSPDLIVLDLLLPGASGADICRALRKESAIPIIMLTALSTEQDKLNGLDLGADDYLTKPFSPRELVARVRAVLRRTPEDKATQNPNLFTYGNLSVDVEQCTVRLNGEEIRMTPTEFRILLVLIREPGRVFSRSQLVEQSLGYNYEGMERTVDVHVLKLRRKLEQDPNGQEYILTVYGMGYKFGA